MIKTYLIKNLKIFSLFSSRKIILPEVFTSQKIDDHFLIKSTTYEFLISRLPQKNQIYKHQTSTPATILKKPGIHILPNQIPQLNKRQKYSAVYKKIQAQFDKAYRKCKQPQQFFHMNRKVKTDIRKKLEFIGVIDQKLRHYMLFEPYYQKLKNRTKQEYMKKGVKVECLGGINIYPKGEVWMPTNQKYLVDFIQTLKQMEGDKNIKQILDLGCGSGILSFLCKKSFKKSKIFGFDSNQAAVDTTNINSAQHHFDDVKAFLFDIKQTNQFRQKLKQQKIPNLFDLILINPPWLHAKRLPNQSELQEGVYDQNGAMLQSSLKIASQHLKDKNSKVFLIYSDLNKNLNLQKKSVSQICKQNSLLIQNIKQRPLVMSLQKSSPLNQFKQKSNIQLYQIRKA